jgi:hypothetical protein
MNILSNIIIKKKDSNQLICSNFVNKNYEKCEDDLNKFKNLICIITGYKKLCGNIENPHLPLRSNEYIVIKNTINDFYTNLNEGKYKIFIQKVKDIILDDNHYIIYENDDRVPKKYLSKFITNIIPTINNITYNDDIELNNEEFYNTFNNAYDLEKNKLKNNQNEWNKKRNELDELCSSSNFYTNQPSFVQSNCNKYIDEEEIDKNIKSIREMSDRIVLPSPPLPPIDVKFKQIEETKQIEDDKIKTEEKSEIILKKYVETFKTIYLEPFFYQISSLDTNDFVLLFNDVNDENKITIKYYYDENNKSSYNYNDLFSILFNFLYVDVTEFYLLIDADKTDTQFDQIFTQFDQIFKKIGSRDKIKTQIDTDTKNALNIKNTENNKKFLFVKNFYEIIEKVVTIRFPEINYVFVYFISLVIEKIKDIIKLYKILKDSKNSELNDDVYKKLEEILSKKSSDMVLTFLKINNFEKVSLKTNKRFNIDYESIKENKLILDYNDDNIKYYSVDSGGNIKTNENALEKLEESYKINKYTGYFEIDKEKYKNKYILGPFTKVFNYELDNQEIANQLKSIQELLNKEIPVFILGYGASGAGKTSSLIYNSKNIQNGIIIELCNIMHDKGYNTIELKSCEFYAERIKLDVNNNKGKTIVRNIPENKETIKFNYIDDNFKLTEDYIHKNIHIVEINGNTQRSVPITSNSNIKKFEKGTTIGNVMEYITDKDRLIFATTNNPNSSRSHSLSFIKFTGSGKEVSLIVGDFAGVENTFDCDSNDTIIKFENILVGEEKKKYYDIVEDKEALQNASQKYSIYTDNIIDDKKDKINLYNEILGKEHKKYEKYIDIRPDENNKKYAILYINEILKTLGKTSVEWRYNFIKEITKYYITGKKENIITQNLPNIKARIEAFYTEYNKKVTQENLKNKEKRNSESRFSYFKNICKLRRNEGYMINESLEEIRKVIKYLLIVKNKDKINISPPFIKDCIDFYCSGDKCFPLDRSYTYSFEKAPSYTIFREIYNYLGKDAMSKLVISVFCVLNISRIANNPPPIPYIDINIMKKLYYNPPNNSYEQFMKEIERFFEKENDKFINPPLSNFDITDSNVEIFSIDAINNVKTLFENNDFKDIIISLNNIKNKNNNLDNYDRIRIEKFFNLINNFNASSAIGTLEFLDQLAKFNTTNSICKIKPKD